MPLHAGDWVQTQEGYRGKILLVSRQSAFVDIEGHDEIRARPYLLSELYRIEPPTSFQVANSESKSPPR